MATRASKRIKAQEKVSVGAISVDTKGKSHKTFDEDDENDDDIGSDSAEIQAAVQSSRIRRSKDDEDDEGDDDDGAPEEFTKADEKIKKLQKDHEETAEVKKSKPKTKKRRREKPEAIEEPSAEELLDADLLDAFDEFNQAKAEEAEHQEKASKIVITKKPKEEKLPNKKNIGNIEVSVLDSYMDPTSIYKIPDTALDFASKMTSSQPRVRYAVYAGQKKIGAAKKFSVGRR
jgi:hypothetical protein